MMGWWWYNCVSKCTNQIALQMPCQECDEIIASAMLMVTTSPVSDRFCGIRSENLKTHTVHPPPPQIKNNLNDNNRKWQHFGDTMYKSLPRDLKSNKIKEYYCQTFDLCPLKQIYSSELCLVTQLLPNEGNHFDEILSRSGPLIAGIK